MTTESRSEERRTYYSGILAVDGGWIEPRAVRGDRRLPHPTSRSAEISCCDIQITPGERLAVRREISAMHPRTGRRRRTIAYSATASKTTLDYWDDTVSWGPYRRTPSEAIRAVDAGEGRSS